MNALDTLKNRNMQVMVINTLARVTQLATGFISVFLLIKVLTPEDLGIFYIVTAIGIAINLAPLNVLHFPIQRLMPDEKYERSDFLSTIVRWPAFINIAIFLYLIFRIFIIRTNFEPHDFIILVINSALSELIFAQGTNITSVTRSPGTYFLSVALRSAAILGGLATFVNQGLTFSAAVFIYSVGAFLPFFLFSKDLRLGLFRGTPRINILQKLWKFGWPYTVSQIFKQVVERGDRVLIGLIFGPSIAGQYSVASDLARRVLQGLTINTRLTYIRDVIQHYDRSDLVAMNASLRKLGTSVCIISFSIAASIALFGSTLIETVVGDDFTELSSIVLVVSALSFSLEAVRSYYLSAPFEISKKSSFDAWVSVSGAIIQTALVFILANTFGVIGATVAVLLAQLLMLTICVAFVHRLKHFHIDIILTGLSIVVSITITTFVYSLIRRADVGLLWSLLGSSVLTLVVASAIGLIWRIAPSRRRLTKSISPS